MISGSRDCVEQTQVEISEVDWQRLELGSFSADLSAWTRLADSCAGPILELGSGTGRVSFHLAEAGHQVIALESRPRLAENLKREADARSLPVSVISGTVESAPLPDPFPALIIAPMQFLHYLEPRSAVRTLTRLTEQSATRPTIGLAALRDEEIEEGVFAPRSLPDMVEVEGWLLSSRISRVTCGPAQISIERLRESVAPDGSRKAEVWIETLWRYRQGEAERIFASVGYCLYDTEMLPEEPGTVSAELLVFGPHGDRGNP